MPPGIRAELKVPAAVGCPLAQLSGADGVTAYSVSKSVDPDLPQRVTEEFTIERPGQPGDEPDLECVDVHTAFDSGAESVYRFERRAGQDCPCEYVETHGYPVADVRGEDGTLYIVFHAPDQDALRKVIAKLDGHYPQVEVRRLVQSRRDDEAATDSSCSSTKASSPTDNRRSWKRPTGWGTSTI